MSKSIKRKLMALVVVGAMAIPMVSFADTPQLISESDKVVISENMKNENEFMTYVGTISEFTNQDGRISILVDSLSEEDEYGMVFHIADTVSIWSRESEKMVKAKDLKDGMEIQVFFNQNTPTTLSLPPQLTPDVIVIRDTEDYAPLFMGEFGKDLVSLNRALALTIGEDTVVINEKGEALSEENIAGNAALVFYGMSTKSIPAQTTPSKVVVFAEKEDNVEDVDQEVEEEDEIEIEEVKEMIALRETATGMGYKVQWDNEKRTAEITKQNQTIVVELDSIDYTLNKSLGKFFKAPELRNNTLYVSAAILDVME